MQLLKLIYVAHGWHLETSSGNPLIQNKIEAWKFGQVIPLMKIVARMTYLSDIAAHGYATVQT